MSFQKYRLIDLTMLIVLGIITEALGVYLGMVSMYNVSTFNPYSVIALGLICLAVTRYGWWGALLIPFLALSNTISYTLTCVNFLHSSNAVQFYIVRGIGCLLQMCSPLVLMAFYRKGTNEYLSSMSKVAKVTAVVAGIATAVIYITAIVDSLMQGNLKPEVYMYSLLYSVVNLAFGIISMFIINLILYKRGTFADAYETILDKQLEKEAEEEYYNVNNQSDNKEK